MPRRKNSIVASGVAEVYRRLADQHVQALAASAPGGRQESTWRRVQDKLQQRQARSSATRRTSVAWATAVSVAALLLLLVGTRGATRLEYDLVGGARDGDLIVTGSAPASLVFTDQSRVEVAPETSLNVSLVGEQASMVRLSKGAVHVKVVHQEDTDWRFFAGPYEVHVVGTEFDLAWDKDRERLQLRMIEGEVRVAGGDAPVTVKAGQELVLEEPRAVAPPASAVAALQDGPEAAQVEAEPTQKHNRVPHTRPKALDWSALVASGQFAEVIELAQAAGVREVLSTRGAAELGALARAAHYTGSSGLAVKAWGALRKRFAGSSAARSAAFFLGRLHDQRGQLSTALHWFETYLGEAPGGVYAPEAHGRRLNLVQQLRGAVAARAAARDYLRRYPRGPYGKTARDIASGQ